MAIVPSRSNRWKVGGLPARARRRPGVGPKGLRDVAGTPDLGVRLVAHVTGEELVRAQGGRASPSVGAGHVYEPRWFPLRAEGNGPGTSSPHGRASGSRSSSGSGIGRSGRGSASTISRGPGSSGGSGLGRALRARPSTRRSSREGPVVGVAGLDPSLSCTGYAPGRIRRPDPELDGSPDPRPDRLDRPGPRPAHLAPGPARHELRPGADGPDPAAARARRRRGVPEEPETAGRPASRSPGSGPCSGSGSGAPGSPLRGRPATLKAPTRPGTAGPTSERCRRPTPTAPTDDPRPAPRRRARRIDALWLRDVRALAQPSGVGLLYAGGPHEGTDRAILRRLCGVPTRSTVRRRDPRNPHGLVTPHRGPGLVTIAGILLLGPRALRHWLDARQDVTLDELRRPAPHPDPLVGRQDRPAPRTLTGPGNGPARDTLHGGPRQRDREARQQVADPSPERTELGPGEGRPRRRRPRPGPGQSSTGHPGDLGRLVIGAPNRTSATGPPTPHGGSTTTSLPESPRSTPDPQAPEGPEEPLGRVRPRP